MFESTEGRTIRWIVGLSVVLLCGNTGAAYAQSNLPMERSRYDAAAYYSYAEPGDITILVNVWGTVRNPGLYEIPQGTQLSTLFSVTGGPSALPRHPRDQRIIIIRLSRQIESGREVIYESTMEGEISAMEEDPVLQEGDILTVETLIRQRFGWRDVFPIVAAIASVALAVERVAR